MVQDAETTDTRGAENVKATQHPNGDKPKEPNGAADCPPGCIPAPPPTGGTTPPKRKPCGRSDGRPRRKKDCCRQLLEMLKQVPGVDLPEPHKPKQRPSAKANCLCQALPVADALLPAMAEVFSRFDRGLPPRNDYEGRLHEALDSLDLPQREALRAGFEGMRQLPRRVRNCIFDDGLTSRCDEEGLRPSDVIETWIKEGLGYVGQTFFSGSGGIQGPGQVRLWDIVLHPPPNGSREPRIFTGPWPWLTAIRPDAANYKEFGSTASHRPHAAAPPYTPQPYQIAKECTSKVNPLKPSELVTNCVPKTPMPPPPGSFGPSWCEGGPDYTYSGQCLQLPVVEPGAVVALRGINFITKTVKVLIEHETDKSARKELEAPVYGDLDTPQKDEAGHVIADWRVRDIAVVTVPREHPAVPGAPLPPGLYYVTIYVDNVLSTTYAGGVPPRLQTNFLLLHVEPDPNVKFRLWSSHGFCYEETDGLGSDEAWFDAWVANFVVADQPTGSHALSPLIHVEVNRDAWDGMNSGDGSNPYDAELWNGSFNKGLTVVGLIGFEVDSEAAARDQIRSFGGAFAHYLKNVLALALAAEGAAASIAKMVSLTLTQGLIVLAVIAAVILVVGLIWASWAAADRIAIDLFTMDGRRAWSLTSPETPLPSSQRLQFEEITTDHNPQGKQPDTPLSQRYVFEHRYVTPEDGKDSDYGLTFNLTRI